MISILLTDGRSASLMVNTCISDSLCLSIAPPAGLGVIRSLDITPCKSSTSAQLQQVPTSVESVIKPRMCSRKVFNVFNNARDILQSRMCRSCKQRDGRDLMAFNTFPVTCPCERDIPLPRCHRPPSKNHPLCSTSSSTQHHLQTSCCEYLFVRYTRSCTCYQHHLHRVLDIFEP